MAKSSRKHTRADRSTPYPGAPPREIAAEMSAIATAIKATEKSADIANGERLLAAKKLCRDTGYFWLPWLKHECGFSERKAQRLMNIAKKSDKFVGLDASTSALGLLAQRSTPPEVVDAVAQRSGRLSYGEVRARIAGARRSGLAPNEVRSPVPVYPPRSYPPARSVEPVNPPHPDPPPRTVTPNYVRGAASEVLRAADSIDSAVALYQVGEIGAALSVAERARLRRTGTRLVAEADAETATVIQFPGKQD